MTGNERIRPAERPTSSGTLPGMQGPEVTLVSAARRRIGLVLAATVAGLVAGVGLVVASSATYTSSVQLYASVAPEVAAGRNVFTSINFIEGRATTYASLVGNSSFEDAVAETIGASDPIDLAAVVDPETALLRISAEASSAELAQQAATAAADQLVAVGPPLDSVVLDDAAPGTPAAASVSLAVSDPATLPGSPSSPVVPLFLAVGLLAGLGLGLAGATLAARIDDRIHEPDDLGELADQVGPVFWLPVRRGANSPAGPGSEEYRLRLAALHHEFTALPRSRGAVLVLTAPTARHADTSGQVADDLSIVLGQGGRSSALVVMREGAAGAGPGLSDVLAESRSLESVVDRRSDRLTIGPGTQPLRLLTASAGEVSTLIAQLNEMADVVVVDAPDLSAPAGTAVLSAVADAVLVVAGRGNVNADELLDSRATIRRWHATYLGVLVAPRSGSLLALPTRRGYPAATPVRDPGSRAPAQIG